MLEGEQFTSRERREDIKKHRVMKSTLIEFTVVADQVLGS